MNLDYLLITATKMEQERVQARMEISETDDPLVRPWHLGSLCGKPVLLIEGGVGQVNTAVALTLALTRHDPAAILQFGVGGAYVRSGLEVGDLAIATEEYYGDTGVLTPEGWMDLEGMGFPMLPVRTGAQEQAGQAGQTPGKPLYNRIPLDVPRTERISRCLEGRLEGRSSHQVATGPFVTVQQCSGVQAAGDTLAARYGGICENMEGAAAAHVAKANDIPFVEIRGISNRVVDRDLSQWDLPLAIRRCQRAVELIVESGVC
ncbi:MAG: futalosine hydrolase [Gemmatimonadota bacterium]|nr:futalosine hydrolase [Gemmatimonadota bacterium]MXW05732.1 futalosine hydrolase [Gemmatimonadota bacterium]MYB61733.1 futalosine hydrolase [Gemmatimonadota bacterium]